MYRSKGSKSWVKAKVISKGGKAKGKNWAYLNVQDEDKDEPSGMDFVKDVQEWRANEEIDEVNAINVPVSRHTEETVKSAKKVNLRIGRSLEYMMKFQIKVKN